MLRRAAPALEPSRPGKTRPRPRPLARFARAERLAVLEESIGTVPSPLDPVADAGDARCVPARDAQ
jgi:hypothetical protein